MLPEGFDGSRRGFPGRSTPTQTSGGWSARSSTGSSPVRGALLQIARELGTCETSYLNSIKAGVQAGAVVRYGLPG